MENLNFKAEQSQPEKRSGLLVWVTAGVLLGLVAANGFLFVRTSALEAELNQIKATTQNTMVSIEERATTADSELRRTIEELNTQLEDSRTKAAFAATRAKATAEQHAEKLVQNLAAQQDRAREAVIEQIGVVKNEATQTAQQQMAKVNEVATEVGTVKVQFSNAKAELDRTIADLKSVRGDLGIQSGLIATNAKELAALKELGERNYFEFNITKATKSYKIGGIVMTLKKADVNGNKYNLELVVDDKRVEKKDKTINEPVQFYVSGARQPYELVVNEVQKDRIIGYLATPKVMLAGR